MEAAKAVGRVEGLAFGEGYDSYVMLCNFM